MRPVKGRCLKYGDNINTDLIIQNAHLNLDIKQMGRFCLANLDATFAGRVSQGDILVAGRNFGCGSAKPAQLALLGAGIECVIAKSFARIFFRNAINAGLLPIESGVLADSVADGDRLEIDFSKGVCLNVTQNKRLELPRYPALIERIIECGGIVNMVKKYGVD
jgi:3-isopropylmalate/(R)-2-methylmalate dehydratase small subunit